MDQNDKRLIEHGFPCHQVGAETQRERGASSALPPLYFLHVWWARRPLTPSRAAIVASLSPADADPELFVRQLGIERIQALVEGQAWTLDGDLLGRIEGESGEEVLEVDDLVLRRLLKEQKRRAENREMIARMKTKDPALAKDPVLQRWELESEPLPVSVRVGESLPVERVMGDPAWAKQRIAWESFHKIRTADEKYGYSRAFTQIVPQSITGLTVLDPTAGGGSIPFEALRLGHNVIANELNPVGTAILYATLDYPVRFGVEFAELIEQWGNLVRDKMVLRMKPLFPALEIPKSEMRLLTSHLRNCPEFIPEYAKETLDGFIYARQVVCPHCEGEAPLLNTFWLSKQADDPWGVRLIPDGKARNGTVRFQTYRVRNGHGPRGEDPGQSAVTRGLGTCPHCAQAITGDEIKRQARGEPPHGRWQDRLYAVVAVRFEPKLDKHGKPLRYKSGAKKGEIKTRKVRFFRPPNQRDLEALAMAQRRLEAKWPEWEAEGLIPMEEIPPGHRRDERDGLVNYGITHWRQMFTPRQLLGHLYLIEGLNRLKPEVLSELGREKGRAVITYLQFAIDKGLDYNSKQTRWEFTRGVVKGTFSRHDFSLKWTFGEMVFTGPNSGAAWGLSQVLDAYKGIAALTAGPRTSEATANEAKPPKLTILNGTAAHLPGVADASVDLVCMDPPYYNNVQYAELSDYFYVWQRRTLKDLYPDLYRRRLVNKADEAVANPARDGGTKPAKAVYEAAMQEIFAECRRVLRPSGVMTLMFTHKSQDAWETLTRSLIEAGWSITASFPVESEGENSMHQKDIAAAASSIFIACRKRTTESEFPAAWTGLGGSGIQPKIRAAVTDGLREFAPLRLNPVDEMVACYGRALHVLSEHWPVMDGDDLVSPIRAMNEASRVVAQNQIRRITEGRIQVDDLDPETAMALTLYGIYGLYEFPYDEALNLSKSLNIALVSKTGGYRPEGQAMIGVNQNKAGRRAPAGGAEPVGFAAPLVRKGSKLRLCRPEQRDPRRLEHPQTDWDILHGLLMAHRRGDVPVARTYLQRHAQGHKGRILDLLEVWAREVDEEPVRREAEALRFGLGV